MSSIATVDTDSGALVEIQRARHWLEVEETIRRLYAPDANEAEWEIFKQEAQALDLNPVKNEYIALAIGNEKVLDDEGRAVRGPDGRDLWRKKYRGYITIHGIRALAAKTGLLDGTDGPFWCGPDGVWKEVWLDLETQPVAARFTVYVKGSTRGFHGVCTMKRAGTRTVNNKVELNPTWATKAEVMLAIRAEADAYKRAGLLAEHPVMARGEALEDGGSMIVINDAGERIAQGRRIHAIAASRGVDHDGVRAAVRDLDPDLESLSSADTRDVSHAAEELEVFDAEGIERLTGTPAEEVVGEPFNVAPAPTGPSEDGLITEEQRAWIFEYESLLSDKQRDGLTIEEENILSGRSEVTYQNAERMIMKIRRLLGAPPQDPRVASPKTEKRRTQSPRTSSSPIPEQPEPTLDQEIDVWDDFWKRAKAAGFSNATELKKAGKVTNMPGTIEAANMLLDQAIRSRRLDHP